MAARRARLRWRQEIVVRRTADHVELGMRKATVFVRDQAKRLVSTGQPTKVIPSGRKVGLDPSREGQPPRVVEGQLRNSIQSNVVRKGMKIIGSIGSNLKKSRRLELGFTGRDSLGRSYRQKARPFLRPALVQSRRQIREFIKRG